MELIKSVSIEMFVARRDACVKRLEQAFREMDCLDKELRELHQAAASIRYLSSVPHGDNLLLCGERGLKEMIAKMEAGFWQDLMIQSGMKTFMSASKRQEWNQLIHNHNAPAMTVETVRATFEALYQNRYEMMVDGVIEAFRGLSWDYKRNSPKAFTERIIVNRVCSKSAWSSKVLFESYECDKLDDLNRVMHLLDGKPEPDARNGVQKHLQSTDKSNKWVGEYLEVKFYGGTGTGHVRFVRKDLLEQMNRLMGSRFPDAIASDIRNTSYERPEPKTASYRWADAGEKQARAECRVEGKRIICGPMVQSYKQLFQDWFAFAGGEQEQAGVWFFPHASESELKELLASSAFEDPKAFEFYPTPPSLADRIVKLAKIQPGMRVLEPSAGHGAIAEAVRRAGAEPDCIEASHVCLKVLRQKGFTTVGSDFMNNERITSEMKYDRIVANPPFSDYRDIAHVMRMYDHLNEGGRIVSVMGAGILTNSNKHAKQFRAMVSAIGRFEPIPEGTFKESFTSVNTVLVILDRPTVQQQLTEAGKPTSLAA